MASPERKRDLALKQRLLSGGARFDFFQAVELLHRLTPGKVPVGQLGPPREEPVRFRGDIALAFHSSDVLEVRQEPGLPPVLVATFMGLTGATSPLPTVMTEEVLHAEHGDGNSLRDFYDLLHHRLFSLLFRVHRKYQLHSEYRSVGEDSATRRLICFVGIDPHAPRPARSGLDPLLILSLASLFTLRTRPAREFRVFLEHVLPGVPVAIEQFVSRRVHIQEEQQVRLGLMNCRLGADYTVGRRVLDRSGRFRLRLGPVSADTAEALMPGGRLYARLRDAVSYYGSGVLEAEASVSLEQGHTPTYRLGGERGAVLGVSTRLPSAREKRVSYRFLLSDRAEDARPEMFVE